MSQGDVSTEFFEKIWGPLRSELTRDYVGVWMVAGRVREVDPHLSNEDLRDATLACTRRALERKELRAGRLVEHGGFTAYSEPVDETIARIGAEWDALGSPPNPGEGTWFDADPSA